MITASFICLVLACVSFFCGAFRVPASVDWHNLGFALLTLATIARLTA